MATALVVLMLHTIRTDAVAHSLSPRPTRFSRERYGC